MPYISVVHCNSVVYNSKNHSLIFYRFKNDGNAVERETELGLHMYGERVSTFISKARKDTWLNKPRKYALYFSEEDGICYQKSRIAYAVDPTQFIHACAAANLFSEGHLKQYYLQATHNYRLNNDVANTNVTNTDVTNANTNATTSENATNEPKCCKVQYNPYFFILVHLVSVVALFTIKFITLLKICIFIVCLEFLMPHSVPKCVSTMSCIVPMCILIGVCIHIFIENVLQFDDIIPVVHIKRIF